MSIQLFKVWFLSARPPTWVAGICPVLLAGVWVYGRDFSEGVLTASLLLLACLSMQIACNFTNDYYDTLRGVDDENRKGPKRIFQQKLVTPETLKKVAATFYGLAITIALYYSYKIAMLHGLEWGVMLVVFTGLSTWVGFAYTGGKYPLGYHGLGDLAAWIFFGPGLVVALIWIMDYSNPSESRSLLLLEGKDLWGGFLLGLTPGFFSLSLININNLRDLDDDQQKGKITFAVILKNCLGKNFAMMVFVLYIVGAYVTFPLVAFGVWRSRSPLLLGYLVFLLPLVKIVRCVVTNKAENRALKITGMSYGLHTIYSTMIILYG